MSEAFYELSGPPYTTSITILLTKNASAISTTAQLSGVCGAGESKILCDSVGNVHLRKPLFFRFAKQLLGPENALKLH